MAQFDVHRMADGLLVVDLQGDLIDLDVARIVAPLRAQASAPMCPASPHSWT